MNNDDQSPSSISPELESRIVALVLGEASPVERAELARLVAENPELLAFQRSIEEAHGLLAATVQSAAEPLRLSADRRAQLLATLAVDSSKVPAAPARKSRRWTHWALPLAACLALCLAGVSYFLPEAWDRASGRRSKLVYSEAMASREEMKQAAAETASDAVVKLEPFQVATPVEQLHPAPVVAGVSDFAAMDAPGGAVDANQAPTNDSLAMAQSSVPNTALDKTTGYLSAAGNSSSMNFDATSFRRIESRRDTRPIRPDPSATMLGVAAPSGNELSVVAGASGVGSSPGLVTYGAVAGKVSASTFGGRSTRLEAAYRARAEKDHSLEFSDRPASASVEPPPALDDAPSPPALITVPNISLQAEIDARKDATSTFSLHVSDVSFSLAGHLLARGELPAPGSLRPEEFYNAFDYGDPSPAPGEPVSCRIDQAADPFVQQRNLVRIAIKVPADGRRAEQPLRLTVLLDTSGSMLREDRVATIRRAFSALTKLLKPSDEITLIGFAREPRLLADRYSGNRAAELEDIIKRTPADGGTNLEAALKLAGERARLQFAPGAQNRIVILTDGAANLGNDNPEQLASQVAQLRQDGLALDAWGIGVNGLDDSVLEGLTRRGGGRYGVVNSPEEVDAAFARKLAGALRPAAENVKVQVRFNPARVHAYRLIGFEKHRLAAADFRNDAVSAAAITADDAAVAVYEVEGVPEGDGELGEVSVRFQLPGGSEHVEQTWTLPYQPKVAELGDAAAPIQLAGVAALLAEKLNGGPAASAIRLEELVPTIEALRGRYPGNARVAELIAQFQEARRLLGE